MSTDNTTELLTQVAVRANALCQSVQDHAGNINATVNAKKAELDVAKQQAHQDIQNYIAGARGENSHILLSRNQKMELIAQTGASAGIKNMNSSNVQLTITKVASIYAIAGEHDEEHSDEGIAASFRANVYPDYVNSKFHILRVKWTRTNVNSQSESRLDDDFSQGYLQGALTTACYIKPIAGSISARLPIVKVYGDGWQLRGRTQVVNNPRDTFHADHTRLAFESDTGEILICLFGTASGFIDLEKVGWGRFAEFARPSDIANLTSRVSNLETPTA